MYSKNYNPWVLGPTNAINDDVLNAFEDGINDLYVWISKNNTNDAETLSVFDFVFADTSTAAFTLNLPATPTLGDVVKIADESGTFGTNALTVGRNGENIMGLAEDMDLDVNNASVVLTYSGATNGWVVTEKA